MWIENGGVIGTVSSLSNAVVNQRDWALDIFWQVSISHLFYLELVTSFVRLSFRDDSLPLQPFASDWIDVLLTVGNQDLPIFFHMDCSSCCFLHPFVARQPTQQGFKIIQSPVDLFSFISPVFVFSADTACCLFRFCEARLHMAAQPLQFNLFVVANFFSID